MNNYVYVEPNSQRYTDIDQLIHTMNILKSKISATERFCRNAGVSLLLIQDDVDHILIGLENTKKDGLNLKKE